MQINRQTKIKLLLFNDMKRSSPVCIDEAVGSSQIYISMGFRQNAFITAASRTRYFEFKYNVELSEVFCRNNSIVVTLRK